MGFLFVMMQKCVQQNGRNKNMSKIAVFSCLSGELAKVKNIVGLKPFRAADHLFDESVWSFAKHRGK